jgi:hypothetical protein
MITRIDIIGVFCLASIVAMLAAASGIRKYRRERGE